jgi:competence protein ComEA
MTVTTHGRRVGAAAAVLIGVACLLTIEGVGARQTALPEGRGKQEFERVCAGCHPAEDAVKGGRRSREGWQRVIDDMVVRGAEGSDDDLKVIVDYLTAHFGPSPDRR